MHLKALPRLFLLYGLTMAALFGSAFFAYGQSVSQKWEMIRGSAIDVAVGGNGAVAAIDKSGRVYRYNFSDGNWQPIGRNMARIAASKSGEFWGVDTRGNLRVFKGSSWNSIGGGAADVAVSGDGQIYVVTNSSNISFYSPASRQWKAIDANAARVAIDKNGMIWIIGNDGAISRRLDDAWIGMAGSAADITADENGVIYIVGSDGKLYSWDEDTKSWSVITGANDLNTISVAGGQFWSVNNKNQIYAQGLENGNRSDREIIIGENGDGGSTDPSETIDNSPITFSILPDTTKLVNLAIGRDGSVYGLASSGDIKRWSNTEQRFYDFPGTVEDIAVKDNGLPLAIGSNNNLLEHDGEAWRQVNLALSLADISVYGDMDRLLAISSAEQAVRLSDNYLTYTNLPKQGNIIAAAPNGNYWIIDDANRLFLCVDGGTCERQSLNAEDIDSGPAGSVFIVDTNQKLRRYNSQSKEFDLISTPVNVGAVSIGPQDRPWIIDTSGQVYYSDFFERDETFDRRLAIKTTATEFVTTEEPNVDGNNTGIQIVQSVSFTPVTIPTSASGYSNLSGLRDITVGENDIVIATGFSSPCNEGNGANWVYNPNSRSFSYLDYLKGINLFVGLALDDLIVADVNGTTPPSTPTPAIPSFIGEWNKDCADQSELITYVASVFGDASAQSSQSFDGASFSLPQPFGVIPDLDFAADGTVFNLFGDELEFFQPENANDVDFYDDIEFMRVGAGVDKNDFWAVSTSNNVYEYVQSSDSFELRSNNSDDKAQDIGVGQDGTVFIVNTNGVLKKWDKSSRRFIRTNKTGVTRVAVDSRGNPIVANFPNSQVVYFGR